MKQLIAIGLALALVAGITTFAGAAETVDQQQTTSWYSFPVDYWAQTFRTGAGVYNLTSVDLEFGTAGSYNVQIRTVAPYALVGSSGFLSLGAGVQHVQMSSMILVTPETDYEIRVMDSTPNFSGDYYVKGWVSANLYTRGTARFPGGGNDTYGHDWYFKTYFVPEPSSLACLAGGLAGLSGLLRRKR